MASESNPMISISRSSQRCFFITQIILRILAIVLSLAAAFVLITSKQSVMLFGVIFSARYNDTSANKVLACADFAVCGLSVLSLVFVCLIDRTGSSLQNHFFLFLIDMGTMVLMISGCASATAIGYVAEFGQDNIGWLPVCHRVGKFCHQEMISLMLSYLTFFSYLALTIMSASKLMSS